MDEGRVHALCLGASSCCHAWLHVSLLVVAVPRLGGWREARRGMSSPGPAVPLRRRRLLVAPRGGTRPRCLGHTGCRPPDARGSRWREAFLVRPGRRHKGFPEGRGGLSRRPQDVHGVPEVFHGSVHRPVHNSG